MIVFIFTNFKAQRILASVDVRNASLSCLCESAEKCILFKNFGLRVSGLIPISIAFRHLNLVLMKGEKVLNEVLTMLGQ